MDRLSFLGYPVDNLTIGEALDWIGHAVHSKQNKIIAVTNANKLWQAHHNPDLSDFLMQADLVLPEYAVVWGAKRLGISLQHIGGIMLLKSFLVFAEMKQIRPYFLGARTEIVERMIDKIRLEHPRLPICGFHHGYLGHPEIKQHVLSDLREKKPDIVFVAMGSPKQELLMSELRDILTGSVLMGVGGSFDVISGYKQDAPAWARAKGLEWLYRISQDPYNPSYLKRYLVTNTWFVQQVLRHAHSRIAI